jgi:ABC-type transporter Mla subunit MlaD
MRKLPRDLSVSHLERVLERRLTELKSLTRDRDRLQQKLDAVDNKIRSLAGNAALARGSTSTGRARNEKSLVKTLTDVLAGAGRPMKVGEILKAVQQSGYRSNAVNFRGLLNQTLIRERKRFSNTDRATYALKK